MKDPGCMVYGSGCRADIRRYMEALITSEPFGARMWGWRLEVGGCGRGKWVHISCMERTELPRSQLRVPGRPLCREVGQNKIQTWKQLTALVLPDQVLEE